MTEPNHQYGPSSSLPVASPPTYLLLVDSRVSNYQDIINAKQAGVYHIVFDVATLPSQSADLMKNIEEQIAALGVPAFTSIGLIQHNDERPIYEMFGRISDHIKPVIYAVAEHDPDIQTWNSISNFITKLRTIYGIVNFDMMACALYSNPDWKYVIDKLTELTGVTVRASTDDTGAAALGGDWFLESHTGVNLKDVYFTEAIENFSGILVYSTKYDTSRLFTPKSFAVGKATAWGAVGNGGNINTITGGVITSDVVALYSSNGAFAALKTNGSVSTWGDNASGGNQTVGGTSVASSLTSGVVEICSAQFSMAALKSDGTVVTWGHTSYGGVSSSVVLTNVVDIYSGSYAFAALKSNGSLVTWGDANFGANSSTASPNLNSGVVSVNMSHSAGSALKSDGSVITWPTDGTTGGNSSAVTSSISSNVVVVYTDYFDTFAALKNDGRVITWGTVANSPTPIYASSVTLTNIVTLNGRNKAYAALNINGGVVTWGVVTNGGDSSGKSLSSNVVKVYNAYTAFAALKFDGSVVTWGESTAGGDSSSVASELTSGVVAIYGTQSAFAALKSNGKVITWGNSSMGANSSSVATDISAGIVAIYATPWAFSALRNDGKLITWGDTTNGGNSSSVSTDLSAGVVSVNNTGSAFAAITSSATTFDLSMSYYRDIDRYNILRNKENRRRANLTTLNNNVFTLSSARDIQKFNYTIPSGNSFRIIIPDYVSSNYSIISTATLPSPAAANYIISCEEGEPVTISGVTYINYGAFVYRRNADNTFTKMTSTVIGGVTYNLYGGDGIFSSGIAFQYRFGAFAVPAKTFGDASFNITAPLTDSSGAFTYTSSNTAVATVTAGGTVTIVAAGTTTITATQAASGRFSSDSITASLVVNKVVTTLGALTVPAKLAGDAPFTLTAPTSTTLSIISPVNTITSTASMIVPPPADILDIRDISYGTTWLQWGADIVGNQVDERSGTSVSMSADGTVVAIGSFTFNVTGSNEGRTRVYKYNGSVWGQLGSDILGNQADENSGISVSLSADGTIVAIGSSGFNTPTADAGRTRVYKYNGTSWVQLGLDISGNQTSEESGYTVSLSADGTIVAVGSYNYDRAGGTTNAGTNEGRTRVFKYNGTSWSQLGLDISANQVDERSGFSISLSADGTTVAIGSYTYNVTGSNEGRTRIYKYNGTSWGQLGLDILGNQNSEESGIHVSLSADGTIVAIGSSGFNTSIADVGRTRVYKYNGTSWGQLGSDITGNQNTEYSGYRVSLSADGTIVAIGSFAYDNAGGITNAGTDEGRTRVYKYNGTSWGQLGLDISANQAVEQSGFSVSISSDGTTVAIGSPFYDSAGGTANSNTSQGRTRIYNIATTNAITYTSSSSSIADVCGNLLLIKGVNGTSAITASQSGNTYTGRLDVSGTTYRLQYNAITYTSSNTDVATVSTYGTVTINRGGTSTITATQPETRNYASRSVSAILDVPKIDSTLGALTIPAKFVGDAPFTLTAPTSSVSSIISPVNTITSTASMIPTPPEIRDISYGTTWNQLGLDISGNQANEQGGWSVSISADGTVVAIGSPYYDRAGGTTNSSTSEGRTRVYKYNGTSWGQLGLDISGTQADERSGYGLSLSADGTTVAIGSYTFNVTGSNEGRTRVYKYNGSMWGQLGSDILGIQADETSGISVCLSADGTTVAIGSPGFNATNVDVGRTRVYKYNGTSWSQLGLDISGNQTSEESGYSVSLSADGTIVAIGSAYYDRAGGTTNAGTNEGRVRVYKYNGTSWGQLGLDISGTQVDERSGFSVSISADGTTVAIGSFTFNVTGSNEGRTRVFKYNGTSWGQLGSDILGIQADENSGISVSLSADGTIVAIGSSGFNTTAGIADAGRTRVFQFNGTSWGQLGLDISGNQTSEECGYSVSLSTDGTTVAVGSYNYDRAGGTTNATTNEGRVRIYQISTTNAITYTSSSSSIADVCGNLLLIKGVNGTSTITASQSGNTISGRLDVSGTTYTLQYNPITYTISDASLATVSTYGTVTLTGAAVGTSTITATQPETRNYASKSVTASLVVSAIAPTIGTLTVPAKNFGDAAFDLTAPTSNSNGAFSYTSSVPGVATVTSGGRVTVVGSGTTTITATQDASGNYAAGSVTAALVVSPIAPTIGALSVSAKNFGDASFNLTAPTSNSGGAFSYTSSVPGVATVTSGGRVTVVGSGTTTITATQDACGNYTGGSSVTAALVVSPIAPTIGAFTVPEKRINDISFNLTAPSSNSNGAFTFSTDASGSAIVTVTSNGVVGLTGVAGTAIITATQAASSDGNYTGGSSVSATLVVIAALSNFTVPSDKVYGTASFDLTDPTTIYSGEPFIFTSSDTTVASIGGAGGRTVSIHKAGSTTITATQAATGVHAELSITAVLVVAKKTPVITLSAITKNYGDASFNLSPSSTNTDAGAGVGIGTFTFTSRNSDIISIFDVSNAVARGVGSTTIDISQSETTNFTSGSATVAITVNKGTPILSAFTVSTGRTYGSAPFSALAYPTSVSNGAITYSSSDSTVASIDSSGIITLLAAGYVNFTATQQATVYYNSTTKTSNTMTVYRQLLSLTRSSPISSTINKTYGDSYFSVVATNASNGGTITYETDNPSVAGIVGSATSGVISVVSVGTATITARRGQTNQYESVPVSWTVEVSRASTTLTGLSDLSYNVTSAPFTVSASSMSDGAVTYSLQDPSSGVLTIHPTSGLVTLRSAGSAVIVASQAQGTLYLAPASITATITVTSAGNALQGATITSTSSFASVNLDGASLTGVTITNTSFTAAKLSNANLTNAVIVSANFAAADLSGATLAGATITGATFTAASLKNADLSGAVLTSTAFTGSDLSGARLTGVDASGASFANARLTNVDMTGANIANVNFTNTSIKGANIADVNFSPLQKLQLLKNSDNRDIGQIIIPAVTGTTVLAAISESSPLRAIENLDLASATVAVVVPTTSTSPTAVLPDVVLNVTDNDKFYLPINESEFFQIEGVKYFATGGVVRNYLTNAVVEVISYNGTPVWLLAGSIVGLVLQTNTLNSSSFVVPSRMLLTTATPFMPTTLPTSNNTDTPIVYSSNNTNVATIDASSGEITITGNATGFVRFTATQVQNSTYEPGVSVSNTMFVDRTVEFILTGLNQTFNLSTLAMLDASSISIEATDATAVFYVRLSDMNNIFMYQSDASDMTNVNADDIKYYVFHRKWPAELKLNPSHAMMNKTDSAGMLGDGEGFSSDKSLIKHDFIRYIALRLFNTIHGVDLFQNETELLENSVFLGETVRSNIDTIISGVSTTSASQSMAYDASGNKYLTNDASGNTNVCREIIRHIAAVAPSRFYGNVPNHAGLKNIPFMENDVLQYKLVIQAAATQNVLTNVSEIPSRSYTIKLVMKNTVSESTNANTVLSDSIMFPNAYPYSSSVMTYLPTAESSSGVYNIYSPPAPIPFARFGYNGWYYTNSTAWVNAAPAVRNHIKWLVGPNTATSKVSDLQYIRVNLKIHNTAALPYVMVYTQAGSARKYVVVSGNGSLVNGTVYSFYMNFNSYAREPAMVGATNAALAYTIGTGSFANGELVTSIALESDSAAAASNVEFTLSSIVVGELSGEKEYGFEAAVPESYP